MQQTKFSSSFPGPLIVHGLPVLCPFNFPNGNLKQQLSHIGVFICYQNIDAKNKLNLHIHGIHLLNPHKTVVSHLKQPRRGRQQKPHKFAYLTIKNSILHALHVHFSSFDILKTFSFFLRREMTCFAVVWTT